jgi:RNA polymerase sigma-70 factor (ECF subfamily)
MSTPRIWLAVDGDRPGTLEAGDLLAQALREDLDAGASPVAESTSEASPRPWGDERLLGLVAADPSMLGPLYDRYAKLVYGLALAILRSRTEAEDLTHEVFVSLYVPRAYDPDRGSVSAFLTTVTRSRAIDRLRRRSRSARLLRTWHEEAPASPAPTTPFEDVAMWRTAERVRAVVAELPGGQRQVLEMTYYRGLSQSEIADDLDLPLGTVKSRSRRALRALGQALEDLGG